MRKIKLFRYSLYVLFFILSSCATWEDPIHLSYKIMNDKKLEWSDYKRTEKDLTYSPAHTDWVILYKIDRKDFNTQLEDLKEVKKPSPDVLVAYGMTEWSWAKLKFRTDNQLHHEQGHLDIANLYSLEFRNEVKIKLPIYDNSWSHKVDSTCRIFYKKCKDFQKQYDVETKEGADKEKQLFWDNKIQELTIKAR